MPIQIVDNFDLGSPKPIDNRMVVGSQSFYTNKDSITYKYPGLRVWDLDMGIPFVWTGTTFSSENSSAVSGNGTGGFLSKYILNNVIGNSIVFDDGTGKIGINTMSPAYALDVVGDVSASGNLRGNGQFISSINATNITSGNLSLSRLTNGLAGQILVAGTSQPQWINTSQISVGTASGVVVVNETLSGATHYPVFVSAFSGSVQNKVSSTKFQFTPSSGNLFISGNVGISTAAGPERFRVSGDILFNGKLRVNKSGIDAFKVGHNSSSDNFVVETSLNSTKLRLYNPTTPANSTEIVQFSTYTEILTSGLGYINVANSSDRILSFGRSGSNNQVVFYMDNSPQTVPVVNGKGVFIANNLRVNGVLSKQSGSFQIEHPLESKKNTHTLVHSFIEGPQADNIYRGKVTLVNGMSIVNIDINSNMSEGTFVALNRDVQCFTTNETGWTSVRGSVIGNILTIESEDSNSSDVISWMVIGERQDKHMYETNWTDENGKVIVEQEKV